MEIKLGKIVGNVGERWWGQVHDYIPTGQHLTRGRLVAAVSLETQEELGQVKMVETGREVLARLHEQYYGSENPDLFSSLKSALAVVNEEYQEIQVAAIVLVEDIIYVSCVRGGVWVSVAGKEGWVVQSEGMVTSASGRGQVGEVLVAGNARFWKNIPEGFLKAAAANAVTDMEGAVETLAAVEHGQTNEGGEVGVMIKIGTIERGEGEVEIPERVRTEPEVKPGTVEKAEPEFRKPGVVATKVGGWWKRNKEKLPNLGAAVYVNTGDKSVSRRRMMIVGIVFVVVLFSVVGVGSMRNKYQARQNSETQQKIDQVVHNFNEARALVGINNLRSRQLLTSVEQELTALENEGVKDNTLSQMKSDLNQALESVSGIKRVTAEEIINLALIRDDLQGDQIEASETNLYVVDINGSRLVKIDSKKKSGDVISGKNVIGEVKKIAWYPGKIEALNVAGIIEVNENGQAGKQVLAYDSKWQSVTDMEMYGGNLYVLDAVAGKIWRHVGTDAGLAAATDWLAEDSGNVTGDVSMAIDGSIWTIGSGAGPIKKFTRGVKDAFTAEEIDVENSGQQLGNRLVIFVSEESENLYVLDPDNSRIVVWKKTGEFVSQIVSEAVGEARDFTVDEKTKTIYLVGGAKVWGVRL